MATVTEKIATHLAVYGSVLCPKCGYHMLNKINWPLFTEVLVHCPNKACELREILYKVNLPTVDLIPVDK